MIILNKILNKKYNCSIAVETSMVFTFVMLLLFMSLGPMFICKTSTDIIKNLDKYVNTLGYIIEIKEDENAKVLSRTLNDEFQYDIDIDEDNDESMLNLVNSLLVSAFLFNDNDDNNNPFCNIHMILPNNFEVYDDEKKIIKYDYNIFFKEPLNILNVVDINQRFILSKRAFVGSDGNRQFNNLISSSSDAYYIAKDYDTTKIYHKYADCSYLKKVVYLKTYNDVKNDYEKCSYCIKGDVDLNNVALYITATGDNYHINKNCPTMTAYVRVVDKEFVEENMLNMCSRCGKRIERGGD